MKRKTYLKVILNHITHDILDKRNQGRFILCDRVDKFINLVVLYDRRNPII